MSTVKTESKPDKEEEGKIHQKESRFSHTILIKKAKCIHTQT